METPSSPTPSNTSRSSINEDDVNIESEILQSLAIDSNNQMTPKVSKRESIPQSIRSSISEKNYYQNKLNGPITKLPLELLIHILRLLPNPSTLLNATLVCREWCACGIEILWHRPSFPAASPYVKFAHIIGGLYSVNPTFDYSNYVRRLNFSNIDNWISDPYFLPVSKCHRLERLTLTGCKYLSDNSLEFVLESCKNILALDLSGIPRMTDKSLFVIANNCKKLQGMNLTDCEDVSDDGVVALAKGCKHLRRLKLCNLRQITDVTVMAIADNCKDLLEVDLTKCSISSQSISLFWKKGINTREVRIGQCALIDDSAFPQSTNNQSLSNYHYSITNQPTIKHFEVLRYIDLTSCTLITDEAIKRIITHAPKVRNLVLAKCSNLTDVAVKHISKLGKALHSLHLGHVANITDESIIVLARMCTRIRYIDLACCPNLTDSSIIEISRNMPKLKRIGLVRVNNISDISIISLCDRYNQLERIHLSYCEKITVDAIHVLVSRLQKLTHLSLSGIPDFRRPELQKFCRPPPKEFSDHQRQVFCVFSGKGIHDLRNFMVEEYERKKRSIFFEDYSPTSINNGNDHDYLFDSSNSNAHDLLQRISSSPSRSINDSSFGNLLDENDVRRGRHNRLLGALGLSSTSSPTNINSNSDDQLNRRNINTYYNR